MKRQIIVALGAMFAVVLMSSLVSAVQGPEQGPFHFEGDGTKDCGDSRAAYEALKLCNGRAQVAAATIGRPVQVVNPRYGEVTSDYYEHEDLSHSCHISGNAYCTFDVQ